MQENSLTPIDTPHHSRGVSIYNLLLAGWYPAKIARHLKCSNTLVWKHIRKYVRKGKLEQTTNNPSFFVKKIQLTPPLIAGGPLTPHPTKTSTNPRQVEPHKLGGIFAVVGTPRLKPGKVWTVIKEPEYTLQMSRRRAFLWMHVSQGLSADEQVVLTRQRALVVSTILGQRLGCQFSLIRWREDIEWVNPTKELSQLRAGTQGLKKGVPREVAGALHKVDDSSHPGLREINTLPGGVETVPTEHARIEHDIYSGALHQREAAREKTLDRITETLDKLTDVIVAIRQRMELKG